MAEPVGRCSEGMRDVLRPLLLVQAAILVATTLEAVLFGVALGGTIGVPALLSGAAALALLAARARLDGAGRWPRRAVRIVEVALIVSFALNTVLALAIARVVPPLVAVLAQFVIPVAALWLLGRIAAAEREAAGEHALGGVAA